MKKYLLLVSLFSTTFSLHAEQRIISAGSSVTELIYALGAQDKLVAVDSTSRSFVAGEDIPQVGYHRQLSTEALLSLNPTHLIGSDEMGPDSTLNQLKSANVDVAEVPTGDDIQDLYARIDTVARITGTTSKASAIKKQVEQSIDLLEQKKLDNQPKVMFLLINEGRPLTVAGSKTSVDKVISLSGALNPAHDAINSYKALSLESIVGMQPDYLLISERSWDKLGGITGLLTSYPLLKATPAGINQHIIAIPGSALIGGFGLQSIQLSKSLQDKFSG